MNLFNKNPKRFFELVAAAILVLLAYYLVVYFVGIRDKAPLPKEPVTPPLVEKGEDIHINFEEFGVVHIEVDSPSYAKSNFDVNPLTSVTVYFNEEVDLEDVQSRFSLVDKVTGEEAAVDVSSVLREQGDNVETYAHKWQEVWQERAIFTPVPELEPVTMYMVVVESGYLNKLGTGTSRSTFRFEFLTADEPGVLSTNLDNRDFKVKSSENIKIIFKSPMDKDQLMASTSLYPVEDFNLEVNDKIMTITTKLDVGDYRLTVPASVTDIYGRELGENYVIDFSVI